MQRAADVELDPGLGQLLDDVAGVDQRTGQTDELGATRVSPERQRRGPRVRQGGRGWCRSGRGRRRPVRLHPERDQRITSSAATAAGFSPHIPFQAPDPARIRSFVAAGLGVALLAESAARCDGPHIDVHTLRPIPPHPPIGLNTDRRAPVTPTLRAWPHHLEQASPDADDRRRRRRKRIADCDDLGTIARYSVQSRPWRHCR